MISDFKFFITLLSKNQKYKLLFIFFLILVVSFLEVIGIALIIPILNSFSDNSKFNFFFLTNFFPENISQNQLILYLFIILIIFFFMKFIFLFFYHFFQSKYFADIQKNLSLKIFKLYLSQDYVFFIKRNSSELIRNVFVEMPGLVVSYLKPMLFLFSEVLIIIGICLVLITINPLAFFLISIIFLLLVFLINDVLRKRILNWGKDNILHEKMKIKILNETFSTIKNIKILGVEKFFSNLFLSHAKQFFKIRYRIMAIHEVPRILVEFLILFLIFLIILYFYYFDLSISELLPFLGIFAVSAIRIMPSINRILISFQSIQFAKAPLTAIKKEFINFDKNKILSNSDKFKKFKFEKMELNNISFSYNSNNTVLKNLNLSFEKNTTIGIFGKSGSGKTTLIDILLGFLKIESGEILINNQKFFDNTDGYFWRKNIGYVPQDVNLIDDSIKNNIALGQENIDYENLKNALEKSDLNNFVNSLANGIDEVVGEKGVKISGGQKQRIGIARAIYNNCQILILDESTSSLDQETENNILNNIKLMKKNFTIIIISHKRSIMEICDKVYYLDKKKLNIK